MPELRQDPIQKRWIIIAPERARHPILFSQPEKIPGEVDFCPFCPGNEVATPAEIYALRDPGTLRDSPGWKVRVVPNMYPALRIEGNLDLSAEGMFDRMNGIGAHEVIVETPEHDVPMADMEYRHVERVIEAAIERQRDLFRDGRFKYVLIFKNHGFRAGATTAHPVSQIIATPVTPLTVATKLRSARDHYHVKARCIFCDLLDQELDRQVRIVSVDSSFAVLAPFASRFPFELMIIPRRHSHSFESMSVEEVAGLARTMRDTLRRLKNCLEDPPYNLMIHTAPNTNTLPRRAGYWQTLPFDFHWHIEVIPRLTRTAGFEWGTGFYINPTLPEEAAAFLRDAEI
jgi:UDPglucose--hexose-1-phosphate uridylyltransferase